MNYLARYFFPIAVAVFVSCFVVALIFMSKLRTQDREHRRELNRKQGEISSVQSQMENNAIASRKAYKQVAELTEEAAKREQKLSELQKNLETVQKGYELAVAELEQIALLKEKLSMRSVESVEREMEQLRNALAQQHERPAPNREQYDHLEDNRFVSPLVRPLSTFSIDVDTASYSNIRRLIMQGQRVPPDAVRIEEMINYFDYGYAPPTDDSPVAIHLETFGCPWAEDQQLLRVGLKAKEIKQAERPPANLVFLLDVSGSMDSPDKLPWVKASLRFLVNRLDERDRIAIVVYAGASGLVLPSTPVSEANRPTIIESIERLQPGGSTNGAAGIRLAYQIARTNFAKNGVNRVVLATDGDFNVGVTAQGDLVRLVSKAAESGTFLSVLGFGRGNLNDAMLESITNHGDGNYFYIDRLAEAERVLARDLTSTLVTVARDVKVQIEFNPAKVARYRLIAYSNRKLADEDFADDEIDAGDLGAGSEVTALYQIEPGPALAAARPELRYQKPKLELSPADELALVSLRYQQPQGGPSKLIATPAAAESRNWDMASDSSRFAASVALFGMLLRDSEHAGQTTFDSAKRLAVRAATRPNQQDLVVLIDGASLRK